MPTDQPPQLQASNDYEFDQGTRAISRKNCHRHIPAVVLSAPTSIYSTSNSCATYTNTLKLKPNLMGQFVAADEKRQPNEDRK